MNTEIKFKLHNGLVAIKMGDKGQGVLTHDAAAEIAAHLKQLISESLDGRVVYSFNLGGSPYYLDVTKEAAAQFQHAIYQLSLRAAEIANADKIAFDTGILYRAGMPFGLTNHPKIMDMAANEALHNRTLRRAMPSIASAERVGAPTLKLETPNGQNRPH